MNENGKQMPNVHKKENYVKYSANMMQNVVDK